MSRPDNWSRRFGTTSEALFVTDDKGRIQHWNEGAQRLTGYSNGEVIGKRCYSVLCGRRAGRSWCQVDCPVRRSVRRGVLPSHVCLEVRLRDGRRAPVAVAFLVQKERGKTVIAHLIEDASRQDQLRHMLYGVLRLLQDLKAPGSRRATSNEPIEPPPAQARELGTAVDLSLLTRRELEALRLLSEGVSTDAVAIQLGVSSFTARNHIQHTLKKLGLRTRAQAVAAALQQGLH